MLDLNPRLAACTGAACGAVALLAACVGDPQESGDPADEPIRVEIVEPTAGAVLEGTDARVVLRASGIEIAPVVEGRAGTAHHHLFLDHDLTPTDEMIPLDNPRIVHMGDGRSEHTFEGLEPGPHRVIVVLADVAHIPLAPPVADTVEFTIR